MDDTCFHECHLWKKYKENCPNFVRTGWRDESTGVVKDVNDCAPKRTMFLLMDVSNMVVGLQQASNQERNAARNLSQSLVDVMRYASESPGTLRIQIPEGKLD